MSCEHGHGEGPANCPVCNKGLTEEDKQNLRFLALLLMAFALLAVGVSIALEPCP